MNSRYYSSIDSFSMTLFFFAGLLLLAALTTRSEAFQQRPPIVVVNKNLNRLPFHLAITSTRLNSQTNEDEKTRTTQPERPPTYPIARKAMIQKLNEMDPTFSLRTTTTTNNNKSQRRGSYSSVGWSNRPGTVLTPAAVPGVYTACRPFLWNTIDVGCRMTVIELPSSSPNEKPDLWIHSPVLLDVPLMDALEKLGTVKHVISPNYEHVKYAKMWGETYTEAYMWACPGMMEREPNVRWTGELPFGCRPPSYYKDGNNYIMDGGDGGDGDGDGDGVRSSMWDWNEVQPFHVDVELNPFTGRAFFNEVVFFHTSSKTLLTTDTYWNYPKGDGVTNSNYDELKGEMEEEEEDYGVWELAPEVEKVPLTSRLWKVGMDKLFRPFYLNLMIPRDKKEEFKKNIATFISGLDSPTDPSWDVETVIPAHGDIVRGSRLTKEILRRHFNL